MVSKAEWDEKTDEAIAEAGCGEALSEFGKDLEKGMRLRAKAKALEDEADGLKEQAKALLEPAFMVAGIARIGIEGLGAMYWKNGSNSFVSGKKVVENLATAGIDPGVAKKAVEDATSVKKYKYFQLQQK